MDDEFDEFLDGDMSGNEVFTRYKEDEYEEEKDYDKEQEYNEEKEYKEEKEYDNEKEYEDNSKQDENSDDSQEENDSENSEEGKDSGSSSGGGGAAAAGGSAAAAIVAAVVVVTNIISGFKVTMNDLKVHAKSLEYDISIETEYQMDEENAIDWNDYDTGLELVISSDDEEDIRTSLHTGMEGTEVKIEPKSESKDNKSYDVSMKFVGEVNGLTEHHPYTVAVIGEDSGNIKTYYKGSFTTTGPVSQILSICGYCTCNIDGKYHFKLEYEDDNNYFSDFSYKVLDTDGTELASESFDNPDKEQEIPDVDKMKGAEKQLVISFHSQYEPDLNAEHEITELSSGTKMEVHKGTVTITQNILF